MEQRFCRNTELRRGSSGPRTAGFSLIELLVAFTILAIGFLGVVALFPLGSSTVSKSGQRTTAVELAQKGLEELLDLAYDDSRLSPGIAHSDSVTVGNRTYNRSWQVQENVPVTGCKLISYTVSYAPGDADDVTIRAVIARSGR